MHGRKREEYKAFQKDPKTAAKMAAKAQQWHLLMDQLQKQPELTLPLTEKCLIVNPDPLDLWNKRRDHLGEQFDLETELKLTQAALEANPKAYGGWFHRKWVLSRQDWSPDILKRELALTELFLQRDERNFHCWNYRRFVAASLMKNKNGAWGDFMGSQIAMSDRDSSCDVDEEIVKSEFDFTTRKIEDNFSNFSAFHYRSNLLPLIDKDKTLQQTELTLVENAIFTEPDDQSAWWYHRFLLDYYTWSRGALEEHTQNLNDLLGEAPTCKWIYLALLHIYKQQGRSENEETEELVAKLQEIDPDRAGRYKEI